MQNKHLPGLFTHKSGPDNLAATTSMRVAVLRNRKSIVYSISIPKNRFGPLNIQAAGGFLSK